jgi:hypothetical protein
MLLGCGPALAQPGPPGKPEICDVAAALDPGSGKVTVTWSGGTPPFQVLRADAARFDRASRLDWLADRAMARHHVDATPRRPDQHYYYQVYDYYSALELFGDPAHSHHAHDEQEPAQEQAKDEEKLPPDRNYCKGALRSPVTWK